MKTVKVPPLTKWIWLAVLVLGIVSPLFLGEYLKSILILVCIWIIMGISMNLIYGYTGQFSLAHSAFLGIGAYAFALFTVKMGLSFWLAFFPSIAIVGLAACIIGLPSLRLRGPYFILVTISFAIIVNVIIVAWSSLTGGANGIGGVPGAPAIPLPFGSELSFNSLLGTYYFILFFLALIALINQRLVKSLVGRTFIAISRDEELAQSIGINLMPVKLLSFIVSAMFAGVAGILYAVYNSVVSPSIAHFSQGFNALVFLVVGGIATSAGPFIGALVMVALPEVLQVIAELKTLMYGVILVAFIIFMPTGIVGALYFLRPMLERLGRKQTEASSGAP